MNKNLNRILDKIDDLQERLSNSENNLQYIKRLQALRYWLTRFDELLTDEERRKGFFAAYYEAFFFSGAGFSFYERVENSLLQYQAGNRPF